MNRSEFFKRLLAPILLLFGVKLAGDVEDEVIEAGELVDISLGIPVDKNWEPITKREYTIAIRHPETGEWINVVPTPTVRYKNVNL